MPSLLRHGLTLLRAPAVELGFAVRSTLRVRRNGLRLRCESKEGLFASAPVAEAERLERRAADLAARNDLGSLAAASTRLFYRANLARLDGLERLAGNLSLSPAGGRLRALDLGSGDFHYAPALQRWLGRLGGGIHHVDLEGIELDGYGLYRDGHARIDHGEAWARLAAGDGSDVRYRIADATGIAARGYDVVTLFFPFVTVYASLRWGAPLTRLRSRRLLRTAAAAVRPGGWLVIVNQTPREHLVCCRALAGQPVTRLRRVRFGSDLAPEPDRCVDQVAALWQRQGRVPSGTSGG